MDPEKLKNYADAFADRGTARDQCHCGQTFFNAEDDAIDWEKDELKQLEKMQKKGKAIGCECFIGILYFKGKRYVEQCTCWHKHAEPVINYLDARASAIARYLRLEKERLQKIATRAPTVD